MILATFIMIVATIMGAIGALFLKLGSSNFSFHPVKVFKNWQFLLGGFTYVLSIPVYLAALSLLPLSVAYPMSSMTYVWSAIMAKEFLGETIGTKRWLGIILLIVGIALVSL